MRVTLTCEEEGQYSSSEVSSQLEEQGQYCYRKRSSLQRSRVNTATGR
jgi:hypothetical protein